MMRLKAVRQTVSHISSTTVTSRDHMISSAIGSASMRAIASGSGMSRVTTASGIGAEATAMRRLPPASTLTTSPGGTMVVASRSSMIAGPSMRSPSVSA